MAKEIVSEGFSFEESKKLAAIEKERLRCKIKAQKRRDKRKATGLCTTCGNPSNSPDCGDCKRARKQKRLERIKNKQCVSCTKPNENGKDQCDECNTKEYSRYKKARLTEEGRRREKTNQMRHLYGITYEEYEELSAEQGHVCEICQQNRNKDGRPLFVDHDHTTNALRGLLCQKCNSILGMADDSPEILQRAVQYLQKYKK